MRFLVLLAMMTGAAEAADWATKPGDAPFTPAELAALPGQVLVFFDDGTSHYLDDGAYAYTYSGENGGGTAWGSYHIAEDGSVCVDYVSGAARCDLLVRNGGRIVVITEAGERYPVR